MATNTAPILQSPAPPSYVESQRQQGVTTQPAPPIVPVPPPYSPPIPTYVAESSGHRYQRFDVIEGPVTLVTGNCLNKDPCNVVCPSCRKQVMTVTRPVPGALTCLMAALCLFVFCPCAILPFCVPELQDVNHSCPVCNQFIGTYHRL